MTVLWLPGITARRFMGPSYLDMLHYGDMFNKMFFTSKIAVYRECHNRNF